MSVITIHSVDPNGKHTVAAFQNVNIVQSVEPPSGWGDRLIADERSPSQITYELHGADGYEVHEGGALEDAYMSLVQAQAQKIAELEYDKRVFQISDEARGRELEELKDQIRIAIGDKEESEEEDLW